MHLDLADLESVRAFAAEFKAKYTQLDVLVNNGNSVKAKLFLRLVGRLRYYSPG